MGTAAFVKVRLPVRLLQSGFHRRSAAGDRIDADKLLIEIDELAIEVERKALPIVDLNDGLPNRLGIQIEVARAFWQDDVH